MQSIDPSTIAHIVSLYSQFSRFHMNLSHHRVWTTSMKNHTDNIWRRGEDGTAQLKHNVGILSNWFPSLIKICRPLLPLASGYNYSNTVISGGYPPCGPISSKTNVSRSYRLTNREPCLFHQTSHCSDSSTLPTTNAVNNYSPCP